MFTPNDAWLSAAAGVSCARIHVSARQVCEVQQIWRIDFHLYLNYDRTPDDEQFDSVFGCDTDY